MRSGRGTSLEEEVRSEPTLFCSSLVSVRIERV
jgi:hypothetical protein